MIYDFIKIQSCFTDEISISPNASKILEHFLLVANPRQQVLYRSTLLECWSPENRTLRQVVLQKGFKKAKFY
jgi:hypothetical protein